MSLPHAILGVLADGPRHGRAVARALTHLLDGIRPVNPGQVYATLERLTRRGMVATQPVRGDGPRVAHGRTYALTPAGRAALRRWLGTAEVEPETACDFVERLVVLYALGDTDGLARLLAVRRAQVSALRDALERARRARHPRDRPRSPDRDRASLASLLRDAARDLLLAELAWIDDTELALFGARAPAPET